MTDDWIDVSVTAKADQQGIIDYLGKKQSPSGVTRVSHASNEQALIRGCLVVGTVCPRPGGLSRRSIQGSSICRQGDAMVELTN